MAGPGPYNCMCPYGAYGPNMGTQLFYFSHEFLNPDFNRKAMGECSPSLYAQLTSNLEVTLGSQNPGKELTHKGGGWAKTNEAKLNPPFNESILDASSR